jgi:WD40 repeat protein
VTLRFRAAFSALLIAALLASGASPAQDASGHAGPVSALAAGADMLLSGGFDGRVILRDAESQSARAVLRFHDGNVTAVALLPGGRFATGGQDGRVALWEAEGQAPAVATERGVSPVTALAVAEDGSRVAAGFWDGRLAVIDTATGAARSEQAHEGRLSGLAVLPSGDLVTVGADLRFARWSGDLALRASAGLPDLPNGLARTGDRLAVIFAEGALRLFSADGELLPERFLSERPLVAVTATPDTVAAAAVDGAIWILDAGTLQLRAGIAGGEGPVWALALSGDTLFSGGMRAARSAAIRPPTARSSAAGAGLPLTTTTTAAGGRGLARLRRLPFAGRGRPFPRRPEPPRHLRPPHRHGRRLRLLARAARRSTSSGPRAPWPSSSRSAPRSTRRAPACPTSAWPIPPTGRRSSSSSTARAAETLAPHAA